ncbi:MAG: hypothetical protein FD173_943 [Gallionellaceae bacterium]|nr:MAG: hypothetical protein FD173_943 [Gallionellaceae bacterium]
MNLANLFEVSTLTAAVNKLPAMPTKAGAMGIFEEKGIATTTVVIDEKEGRLVLVPNASRNDEGQHIKGGKRKRIVLETAHLPLSGTLLPSELQNLAAFGAQDGVLASQATVINNKLQDMKNSIEATREWQRIGAITGKILDADGKVLYDLYDEFAVAKKSINVAFSTATHDVRKDCLDAKRHAEKKLAGVMVTGFRSFCDAEFFDALTSHESVKAAYAHYQEAQDRLGGDMRSGFTYGGIEFVEYEISVSGQPFIAAGTARVFPIGRGVFQMYNSPANYNETVNTIGMPYYAKAQERDMGKGWKLEVQANPLGMCLFPEALVELKAV